MLALFTFIATWTNSFWLFMVLDSRNPILPVALTHSPGGLFRRPLTRARRGLTRHPLLLFPVPGRQPVTGIMYGPL